MSEEEINKIIEVYDEVITDLKQENSQLKEVIETLKNTNALLIKQKYQLEKDLDNKSNKIEKAIDFINIYTNGINLEAFDCLKLMNKIEEILKGDKE